MTNNILLFIVVLATSAALAAEDASVESREKAARGRVASFVYTDLPDGLENPVSVMAGEEIHQLLLSKLSPSDPVKIPADGILRIVRKVENEKDPGDSDYLTLAQAKVPESVVNAVVILMPAAENSKNLLFHTKVLDLDASKGGDSMFLNMTNLKIGVELGESRVVVNPGEIKSQNPLGDSKTVTIPIRLSYFHPEKDKWAMITASTVALYSTRRELCIFNWDNQFNRVDYESITLPSL